MDAEQLLSMERLIAAFGGYCDCGALGTVMMFEGFVKTGRQLWYCQDHKPDFRALRVAYFDQHGHWPPVGKP